MNYARTLLAGLTFCVFSSCLFAQEPDIAALKQRIADLEKKVEAAKTGAAGKAVQIASKLSNSTISTAAAAATGPAIPVGR